ncbi:recombinase RecX [Nocardia seriolae]|nr:recombinase RecX [Nocardia seriolae]
MGRRGADPEALEAYSDSDGEDRRAGARGRRGNRRRADSGPARVGGDGDDSEVSAAAGGGRRRRGRAGAGQESAGAEGMPGGGTEAQAKDVCLRLLTDRARSRVELADRLAEKGFSAAVAGRVLDRLTEVGLIDDAAFAQQWVRSRHTYAGKGKKVLAEELRRKGIAPEHAEPALESVTAEDETARAADLVRRKLPSLPSDLDRDKATRRLVAMLARRGYNPATAYGVVKAELADRFAPDDPFDAPHGTRPDTPAIASRGDRIRPTRGRAASREFGSGTAGSEESAEPVDDERERAAELVRAKIRSLPGGLDRDKATRRLVGLLARRGFGQSVAYAVVRDELSRAALDSE